VLGLLDTGAFVASALGFATGQVAIVSVLASLYSAIAVVLTAIFLRERLHVIQWLGMSMLLAGVVPTHVERICYTQPIGTNPHASTSPLERRSGGILLSYNTRSFYFEQTHTHSPARLVAGIPGRIKWLWDECRVSGGRSWTWWQPRQCAYHF
jgi:EamA-like transporter family